MAAARAKEEQKKRAAQTKDKTQGTFENFRSKFLLSWIVMNFVFIYAVIKVDDIYGQVRGMVYLQVLFGLVTGINCFRLVGSMCYLLYHYRQSFLIQCCINFTMAKRQKKRKQQQDEERRRLDHQMYSARYSPNFVSEQQQQPRRSETFHRL